METFLVKKPFITSRHRNLRMSFEEDTYSRIFAALKHPVRRKILAILGEERLTYTELLNRLGVETGFLNYHLENLSELIAKDSEGRYHLSEFGAAARSLSSGVEAPVRRKANSLSLFGRRVESRILVSGLVAILILSNAFFVYSVHSQSLDRANTITSSLIQSRGLLIDSIRELNRTVSGGDLGYGDLDALREDMVELTNQCRFLAEMDQLNSDSWLRAADAFSYLSGFAMQLNQQYLIGLGKEEPTSLNWLKVETLGDIEGDLTAMLDLFTLNAGSSNTSGGLSVAVDYSSKLTSDTRYAKVVFGLGELFNGNDSFGTMLLSPVS